MRRRLKLAVFAGGDFAFNLYWQSVILYLLFYYTDVLGVPIETAAVIYGMASLWDGVAGFVVGAVVDRHAHERSFRRILLIGPVPLGAAFVLTYLPPAASGLGGVAMLLATHLAFRTAYAVVNIPYLAMSARLTASGRDRAMVAGLRMMAGTLAAVVVAIGTVPLGRWLGSGHDAYLGAAMLFAGVATAILILVGASYRDADLPPGDPPPTLRVSLRTLVHNRAFTTLALAMTAMIVAMTILGKSVLYYFKYRLGDLGAGQLALASMMATSALAVPVWILIGRRAGVRTAWFIAAGLAIAMLAGFAMIDIGDAVTTQIFLVAVQVATVGLNFALWAMLPNTIEYGQRATGIRVEGATYGVISLLQRMAIGAATAIFGTTLGSAGFVANAAPNTAALGALRLTIAILPLGFLFVAVAVMWVNPLRRGEHARVLADLSARSRDAVMPSE